MKGHSRTGARISTAGLVFLGSVALFITLAALLLSRPKPPAPQTRQPLLLYCAAGLKPPVEAIARQYEQACGVPVQLQFGGSQTLLASLEVTRRGDLFLPADNTYLALARAKGLIAETLPIARMTAVLAVAHGNPKNIRSLEDLARPDVKLAQANPDAAAIGKLVREQLQQLGQWEPIQRRTTVFKPTVNDVANDLKLGTVDAGFLWDAMIPQYPGLTVVPVPALSNVQAHVTLAVLRSCAQPAAALGFARYLAAPDQGQRLWKRFGYEVLPGDAWSERPELRLFAGAMLRPAIEATLADFERREGVRVTRVYNGCGILVAEMRAGKVPDAYFACDTSFMGQVKDLFLDAPSLSANPIVLLLPKNNPHHIQSLPDLARPGLRLGFAHEQQSALGVLTKNLLLSLGLYDTLRTNVVVQSATGDFLVNQLRAGSLDAVIAYFSNGAMAKNELAIIPIDAPGALATQPLAVSRDSPHRRLAERLCETLKSAESKARFQAAGFAWKAAPTPP